MRLLFFFFLVLGTCAEASLVRGLIVTVNRTTQVFERASSRSKVIADVDQGTPLLLLRRSKRGLWLFVEDEEGNNAWIAASHTDFARLRQRQKVAPLVKEDAPRPIDIAEKEKEKAQERQSSGTARFAHEFSAHLRGSWVDPTIGKWSSGGGYTFFFLYDKWRDGREARAGLQLAYMARPGRWGDFSLPLRLRYSVQKANSLFFTSPDIGLTYLRIASKNHYSMSIGYALGMRFGSTLYFWLRPGVDLFYASRFSTELGVALRL